MIYILITIFFAICNFQSNYFTHVTPAVMLKLALFKNKYHQIICSTGLRLSPSATTLFAPLKYSIRYKNSARRTNHRPIRGLRFRFPSSILRLLQSVCDTRSHVPSIVRYYVSVRRRTWLTSEVRAPNPPIRTQI